MRTMTMTMTMAALLLCVTASAAAAPAAPQRCEVLEPGVRLGERLSIGTVLREASAVEADPLPGWVRPKDPANQGVRLRLDAAQRVVELEAPLPPCVTLGGRAIQASSIYELAAALGTCGPEQVNEGGNVIRCAGVTLTHSRSGSTIRLSEAPPTCDVYVRGAKWFDGAGSHDLKARPLELGQRRVCTPNVAAPLTARTTLAAFEAAYPSCHKEARRGATLLTCGELTFTFAGPTLQLAQVSAR